MPSNTCYMQAAYQPKGELVWSQTPYHKYVCFAELGRLVNSTGMKPLENIQISGVVPINKGNKDFVSSFAHYYSLSKPGQYTSCLIHSDRLEVKCPLNVNGGVVAALLSPVRQATETPENMYTFVSLCKKGIHPDIAMVMAMHFKTDTISPGEAKIRDEKGRWLPKEKRTYSPWPQLYTRALAGHSIVNAHSCTHEGLKLWFSPLLPIKFEDTQPMSDEKGNVKEFNHQLKHKSNQLWIRVGYKEWYVGTKWDTGSSIFDNRPAIKGFRCSKEGVGFDVYKSLLQEMYALSPHPLPEVLS